MCKTSKFEELNNNINIVLMKLIENQNLCKYLYYSSGDPLSESDIVDPATALLYKKIFPYPTTTEIFKDTNGTPIASTVINVLFNNFKLGTTNNKFKTSNIEFLIICHMSLWKLDTSQLRPFCILNEIDQIFSEQRVIGIGKGEFDNCRLFALDENYSVYSLVYKDYEFA